MTSSYEYTPYIWPMLTGVGLGAVLGTYAIWHRNGPGAVPFIILVSGIILLVLRPVPQPVPGR